MTEQERIEGGRRARAAMAYAGLEKQDIVQALHSSPSTIGRILDGTRPQTTWDDLWAIADACLLPRDWFSADFSRLSEIVPRGQPTFGTPPELRERMMLGLEEHVQRVRQRTAVGAKDKRGPRRKARES